MTAAIETSGLGRRFGRTWALRDCSLRIPEGRVIAVVGRNGAGKSTLLNIAAGLLAPTTGEIRVMGARAEAGGPVRGRVAFLAQDVPLYRDFTVAEMFELGRRLNDTWDGTGAQARMDRLAIPMERRVGKLSGGQRAQVGLAMALARHPDLLILDELVAALDPLARRDFLRSLMEEVAERPMTVVLSSHLVTELERTCDYLLLLDEGRVRLLGEIEELLATHRWLSGNAMQPGPLPRCVIEDQTAGRQATLLVRCEAEATYPGWDERAPDLEELVLAYMGRAGARALPGPERATEAVA
ncbi:MAG: ABC transporter ATP-binding protein [Dehalococcoidia bacterium]